MNRYLLLLAVVATTCFSIAASGQEVRTRRPNILWIVAENMGPDFACYGTPLVKTPRVDQLAAEGTRYQWAFDTCPVCSPSRSAFMTGMYQTSIGAHNHRSRRLDRFPLPEGVRPITHRLRDAGYFTANVHTIDEFRAGTGKTDVNFDVEGPVIHSSIKSPVNPSRTDADNHNRVNESRLFESSDWNDLASNQPFYAQVNLPVVELTQKGWNASTASPWNGSTHPTVINPDDVTAPPYYPNHPIVRKDWAGYLDSVCGVDARVGAILDKLDEDGLADSTVVIFFADNGRLEVRGLDWCYDSGDRVPLVIRWPKNFPAPTNYQPGSVRDQLVSLIDLTATTLDIAGIAKPSNMQGRILLGVNAEAPRKFVVSARDRTDDAVNRIRSLRTKRYRYTRNFMPEKAFMALHRYKYSRFPVIPLMYELHAKNELTPAQATLMASRLPDEELYDTANDPHEINNLASSTDPEHQRVLEELRTELQRWIEETDDQGRHAESPAVIDHWKRDAARRHGTPLWYDAKFGAVEFSSDEGS